MSSDPKLSYKRGGVALIGQTKGTGGDMVISGLASPFGPPPDEVGDVIEPGSYRKSLIERPVIPILWQHISTAPIGKTILLTEDPIGLIFKARISPTGQGLDAWQLIRDQVISGISIGYTEENSGPGILPGEKRRLKDIKLFELSLVTWPAADRARVTSFAASPSMGALQDAVIAAEGRDLQLRGLPIPQRKLVEYVNAEQRCIERQLYGGKTLRELIYNLSYEIQELRYG
jgi:HK97 family phage prohead protease